MNTIIILSACLFSMSIAYLNLFFNFNKLKKMHEQLFVDYLINEKIIDSLDQSKIKDEESIHKENFIKFLSDSRDWAYQYIEDVQVSLNNFINNIEPEIKYFKEFGTVLGEGTPNYFSMKKISEEYDKLKLLLPKEEIN